MTSAFFLTKINYNNSQKEMQLMNGHSRSRVHYSLIVRILTKLTFSVLFNDTHTPGLSHEINEKKRRLRKTN